MGARTDMYGKSAMETLAFARDPKNQPPTDAPHSDAPQARRGQARTGVAQRLDASLVPAIRGISISPNEAQATLVNISASGALVECERRYNPGSSVTIRFTGTFRPTSVSGRVVRARVSGVGPSGALNYHIGITFIAPITLPDPATPGRDTPQAVRPASATAPAARPRRNLRNNW